MSGIPPSESWEKIEVLFHEALALQPERREAWLRERTGGDQAVMSEVLSLLAASGPPSGPGVISRAIADAIGDPGLEPMPAWIGRDVGAYRLIGELGRGGMGTVYLAERADQTYRARVAIKFVRGGLASPELPRHLVAERQILADLVHPHIARLLDGGTSDDGTPYLVMEYIEGEPLDRYCESRGLGLVRRLELFLHVTAAVQHAHQALVVHRDLKPANILVTSEGVPKLVDFGIAKLLEASDRSEDTLTGAGLMTPAYASPEQLKGRRTTVATDVYALGVVLYQLIAGRHPLGILPGMPLAEIVRRVTEGEPPPASLVACGRALEWRKALTGDLDAILAKALAKTPEERYTSVEQLAGDLQRYLRKEPVSARPNSRAYRLRKRLVRHRTVVAAAALVIVALAGGLSVALWQRSRAVVARATALEALQLSDATRSFLMSLFRANDPSESRGREVTARELLQRGVTRVDSLQNQPVLQAELLYVLGRLQMRLGDYRSSAALLHRSVGLYRRLPGRDTAFVSALTTLGNALMDLGWPDSAAQAWQEAVDVGSARFGPESREILAPIGNLGVAYSRSGNEARAEQVYLQTIALERKVLGPADRERLTAIANLALLLSNTGRYRDARPWFEEALEISRSKFGEEHTNTAFVLDNYGVMLREAGEYDQAESSIREGLGIRMKLLGPEHRFTAESYLSLGQVLAARAQGSDLTTADTLLRRCLRIYHKVLGNDHPANAYVLQALGLVAYNQGRLPEAERRYREALAIRRAQGRRDRPTVTVLTLVVLGHALRDQNSPEALVTFREADSLARARVPATHPYRLRAEIGLALALADQGDTAQAEPIYQQNLEALAGQLGPQHPWVRLACSRGVRAGLADVACG